VLEVFQLGRNAAVDSKDLVVDQRGEGQGVKGVHEQVVNLRVELLLDFHAEVKILSHLSALVVPSQQGHLAWKVQLETQFSTVFTLMAKRVVTTSKAKAPLST